MDHKRALKPRQQSHSHSFICSFEALCVERSVTAYGHLNYGLHLNAGA